MKMKAYQVYGLNSAISLFSYTKASAALVLKMMKNKVALENEVIRLDTLKQHLAESCRPALSQDAPAYNELWDKNFTPLQFKFFEEECEISLLTITEQELDTLIRPILSKITSDNLALISLITELT